MHSFYKSCAVPQCHSTSIKTPNKMFIRVPDDPTRRKKWLATARRDLASHKLLGKLHFCEDHFDLPNDMENYMQFHIMGKVAKVTMKKECIPHKFACQPDRAKRTSNSERPCFVKRHKQSIIEENLNNETMQVVKEEDTTSDEASRSVENNCGNFEIVTMPILKLHSKRISESHFSVNSITKTGNQIQLLQNALPFECDGDEEQLIQAKPFSIDTREFVNYTFNKLPLRDNSNHFKNDYCEKKPDVNSLNVGPEATLVTNASLCNGKPIKTERLSPHQEVEAKSEDFFDENINEFPFRTEEPSYEFVKVKQEIVIEEATIS